MPPHKTLLPAPRQAELAPHLALHGNELIFQHAAFWRRTPTGDTEWLPFGTQFVADMPTLMDGWRLWQDDRLVEQCMSLVADGIKSPPASTARKTVQRCGALQLIELKSGRRHTFTTEDEAGNSALRELATIYGRRLRFFPDTPELPLVELGLLRRSESTPVKLKLQKPVRGPKFTFIGWASPHGGSKVHSTRIQIEGNGSLPCPCCGELCGLHHTGVDVYERNEDSEYVTKTEVRSLVDQCDIVSEEISGPSSVSHQLNVSHIKNEGSGNPSARRHGLAIHFYCEHCGDGIELTLAQHKGHSTLEWRLPVGGAWRNK